MWEILFIIWIISFILIYGVLRAEANNRHRDNVESRRGKKFTAEMKATGNGATMAFTLLFGMMGPIGVFMVYCVTGCAHFGFTFVTDDSGVVDRID